MSEYTPTERTQVTRLPKRGNYDRDTVHKILDCGIVCHVGFNVDGQPYVIPTNYGRKGETVYIHGSAASRMLRTLSGGLPVCITVTHLDGLVLARSAFHHSVNYRSVVILGTAKLVEDPAEKREALRIFTEQVMKGRWDDVRQPTEQELKATTVLPSDLKKFPPRFAPAALSTTKRTTPYRSGPASFPWKQLPSRPFPMRCAKIIRPNQHI